MDNNNKMRGVGYPVWPWERRCSAPAPTGRRTSPHHHHQGDSSPCTPPPSQHLHQQHFGRNNNKSDGNCSRSTRFNGRCGSDGSFTHNYSQLYNGANVKDNSNYNRSNKNWFNGCMNYNNRHTDGQVRGDVLVGGQNGGGGGARYSNWVKQRNPCGDRYALQPGLVYTSVGQVLTREQLTTQELQHQQTTTVCSQAYVQSCRVAPPDGVLACYLAPTTLTVMDRDPLLRQLVGLLNSSEGGISVLYVGVDAAERRVRGVVASEGSTAAFIRGVLNMAQHMVLPAQEHPAQLRAGVLCVPVENIVTKTTLKDTWVIEIHLNSNKSCYYSPFNSNEYLHLRGGVLCSVPFHRFCRSVVDTCTQAYAVSGIQELYDEVMDLEELVGKVKLLSNAKPQQSESLSSERQPVNQSKNSKKMTWKTESEATPGFRKLRNTEEKFNGADALEDNVPSNCDVATTVGSNNTSGSKCVQANHTSNDGRSSSSANLIASGHVGPALVCQLCWFKDCPINSYSG